MVEETTPNYNAFRRYGSEADVEALTGRKRRTLQKDRLHNRGPFSFFRVGRKILYDLGEVEAILRAGRVEVGK